MHCILILVPRDIAGHFAALSPVFCIFARHTHTHTHTHTAKLGSYCLFGQQSFNLMHKSMDFINLTGLCIVRRILEAFQSARKLPWSLHLPCAKNSGRSINKYKTWLRPALQELTVYLGVTKWIYERITEQLQMERFDCNTNSEDSATSVRCDHSRKSRRKQKLGLGLAA